MGETDIRSLNQNSSGLGDINLGAGYFLPFKNVDILPMIFVEFPTGVYNSSKAANIGSNQYDIKPMIFLYKSFGDFSIDAAVKYYFRLKNEITNVSPGDELYVQCLLGYNLTDKFKLGPSINWMISNNKELGGVPVVEQRQRNTLHGRRYLLSFFMAECHVHLSLRCIYRKFYQGEFLST